MTADLTAQLTALIDHYDEVLANQGVDAVRAIRKDTSFECTFDAAFTEPGADGPRIEAHADVLPGGTISEVRLEAWYDGEMVAVDVEPDSGLHQVVQASFTETWDSWDEILEGPPGEAMLVSAADLLPGDHVVRFDLVVASVESAGINTDGEAMLAVAFEDNPGLEVWRAARSLIILRGLGDATPDAELEDDSSPAD